MHRVRTINVWSDGGRWIWTAALHPGGIRHGFCGTEDEAYEAARETLYRLIDSAPNVQDDRRKAS